MSLVGSYESLMMGLEGRSAVAAIEAEARVLPFKDGLYFGCWEVCWIVLKTPFNCVIWVFWKAMACMACDELNQKWYQLKASHELKDLHHLFLQMKHGRKFLSASFNFHKLGTENEFLRQPMKINEVRDVRVKELLPNEREVDIFHEKGICGGMSCWHLYLFLKTHHLFGSARDCLKAIGKEFVEGAPIEAALLQKFKRVPIFKCWKVEDAREFGAYYVKQEGMAHAVAFYRMSHNEMYLFDPDGGTIQVYEFPRGEFFKVEI